MRFDFRIQNYDEENEILYVQYTPENRRLGVIRVRLPLAPDAAGNWPDRGKILNMIRQSAPVLRWQRKERSINRMAEDLLPVADLIGYEEAGAKRLEAPVITGPIAFPREEVI